MEPKLIMTLHVDVGIALPVGRVSVGELTVIPITGGTFTGPGLRGRVLVGGADWNTKISDHESHVSARYWIQTDDGAIICVHNEGVLCACDDPDDFRTSPSFQCDLDGAYAFLTQGQYAGTLKSSNGKAVDIGIWQIEPDISSAAAVHLDRKHE